jgi:hypothetical protein
LVEDLQRLLLQEAGADRVITIRTSVSVPTSNSGARVPRLRWFTLIDPDEVLSQRVWEFKDRLEKISSSEVHYHERIG